MRRFDVKTLESVCRRRVCGSVRGGGVFFLDFCCESIGGIYNSCKPNRILPFGEEIGFARWRRRASDEVWRCEVNNKDVIGVTGKEVEVSGVLVWMLLPLPRYS